MEGGVLHQGNIADATIGHRFVPAAGSGLYGKEDGLAITLVFAVS